MDKYHVKPSSKAGPSNMSATWSNTPSAGQAVVCVGVSRVQTASVQKRLGVRSRRLLRDAAVSCCAQQCLTPQAGADICGSKPWMPHTALSPPLPTESRSVPKPTIPGNLLQIPVSCPGSGRTTTGTGPETSAESSPAPTRLP